MSEVNRYGLSRYIPADISREIRKRSRFGCVICRRGFYQYEHINPSFEDATEHNPDHICCLCGSCHDAVTRGQISKGLVEAKYREIQELPIEKVEPPVGPLDFHNGNAELVIGGIQYSPAVQTILRYHGIDMISVFPSQRPNEPGRISAIFTDDEGEAVLWLNENEWSGSQRAWDIAIEGPRITVRQTKGRIALQLRLDPPGRIVIERLDMRIRDSHILISESTYAVGRYVTKKDVYWVHASVSIRRSSPYGVAIEFTTPNILDNRDKQFRNTGAELATNDRLVVMNANAGILFKALGIAIAGLCGSFSLRGTCIGKRSLADMRRIFVSNPDHLCEFIATGKVTE